MNLTEVRNMIREEVKIHYAQQQEQEQWLSLKELIEYLPGKVAPATVYQWVHEGTIPYFKRSASKLLFFKKSSIDKWLEEGKVDSTIKKK